MALTVDPAFVDISNTASNRTMTFEVIGAVRDLWLPLKWSVLNPLLGNVIFAGGTTASYVSTGASGDKSIIVEDQYGAQLVATVRP